VKLQDYKEKTELEQGGSNNRLPILLLGNKIDLPNLRTDRQECCRKFSYTVASLSFMEKALSLVSLHSSKYLTQNLLFVTVVEYKIIQHEELYFELTHYFLRPSFLFN
jgi:hypothetical protein